MCTNKVPAAGRDPRAVAVTPLVQNPRSTMSESDSRQLTRDELTTMTAEEIVAAERAGRLEALKRGEPGTPPPSPAKAAEGPGGTTAESFAGGETRGGSEFASILRGRQPPKSQAKSGEHDSRSRIVLVDLI